MSKMLSISEIFTIIENAKTNKEKSELILKHNCLALRDILKGSLDDSIEWSIPTGSPPYKKDSLAPDLTISNLHRQSSKLRYFVKGGPGDKMNIAKRELMFINILESIHTPDAEILIAMKDKQLNKLFPSLTKKLVKSVFPKLIVK